MAEMQMVLQMMIAESKGIKIGLYSVNSDIFAQKYY
jgi:hypothetical protein